MASTLTAGNDGATGRGFSDGTLGLGFGSMSPATLAGVTVNSLFTDPTYFPGQIALFTPSGTASALSSVDLKINGSTFANAGQTDYGSFVQTVFTSSGFVFGNGVSYTIDSSGGAPANPNITSASTVPNLIGTKLAHTVTADKTIASMAITGGADAAEFEVYGTSGLRFASDADSDTAGSYVVEVTITDTDGLTDTQTITVPVKYILYVGGKTWSRAGATTTTNVSLTDLTGGIASAPAEGDYVIVQQGIGSNADRAVATTSGYTELSDIYANGTTYDANLGVDAKFMTSTPDTTVTIGSSGSANDAQAARIMVFRGVDPTNPMDVAVVTATGTGTGKPDPGAITPATTGAVGVFSGAQAAATAAALTSSDLTAFASVNQADTNDIAVGAGYIEWSGSGAINPAAFGGGSSNSANSWAAVSLALRPAYTMGGSNGNASGASLTETLSLSAGSASATRNPTANGATLSYSETLSAGSASGAANAGGASLSVSLSASTGAATGGAGATGASLTETLSLSSGAASGNASANGSALSVSLSLSAGAASTASNGNANGASLSVSASLSAGAATGSASATGSALSETLSLNAGSATGAASASGSALSVTLGLSAGLASAGGNGNASGAALAVSASLAVGAASGNAAAGGSALGITESLSGGSATGNGAASGCALTISYSMSVGDGSASNPDANVPGVGLTVTLTITTGNAKAGIIGPSRDGSLSVSANDQDNSTTITGAPRDGSVKVMGSGSSALTITGPSRNGSVQVAA